MPRPQNRFIRNAKRGIGAGGDTCESLLPHGSPVKGAPKRGTRSFSPPALSWPAIEGLDDAVVPTVMVPRRGGCVPRSLGAGWPETFRTQKKVHMEFT